MKRNLTKLVLFIYIFGSGIFASCENEIAYTPLSKEPLLVLNAMLDASSTENFVFLHLSTPTSTSVVNEATVTLYINGQEKETATPVSSHPNKQVSKNLATAKQKIFRLSSSLHPGDNIRIEAITENGDYHATAEVTVPQVGNPIKVDTSTVRIKIKSSRIPYRQYKINAQDRLDESNYYRLEILNDINTHYQFEDPEYPDTTISYQYTDLINREDVILTDGHLMTDDDKENGELFPYIKNKYNIFNDNRFKNKPYTLKVYTPLYNDHVQNALILSRKTYLNHTITVRLLSLSEETYRYLKALNCLESDDYSEVLMEPVNLPTNVKGGIGFVGVWTETKYTLQMPQKVWLREVNQ